MFATRVPHQIRQTIPEYTWHFHSQVRPQELANILWSLGAGAHRPFNEYNERCEIIGKSCWPFFSVPYYINITSMFHIKKVPTDDLFFMICSDNWLILSIATLVARVGWSGLDSVADLRPQAWATIWIWRGHGPRFEKNSWSHSIQNPKLNQVDLSNIFWSFASYPTIPYLLTVLHRF